MRIEALPTAQLGRQLFHMTWPMMFGVLSLMSFQLADSAFIARLGVDPLAALGFILPLAQVIIGTQVGLGIATTAIIARTLGQGDTQRATRLGGLVLVTGGALTGLLVIGLWLFRRPIFAALGAEPSLQPTIDTYYAPWLLSAWCGAMLYYGYSLCRAHGNTRLPGLVMVATSLINIVLDPVFIFTLDGGLAGAAWASVISFSIGMLWVYPRNQRHQLARYDLASLPPGPALMELGKIMGPAMTSQWMPPLSAMLATALVAGFGSAAVAGWGLGSRLEFFSIVVVLALTMSLPPMIGRLLGANRLNDAQHVIKLAVRFVLLWQLAVALIWWALADTLAPLIADEQAVRHVLSLYLDRVPFSYAGLGLCMLMVSVCNALGLSLRAALISALRLFACFLPALWIGAQWGGLNGLMTGALLGNLIAGLMAWSLYQQGIKRLSPIESNG
ncbi:MATE family efflux transporter [Terasakiispira papahanaumokuakeensis]|uniref:MATE family efflux transporter n=1 Tax=Terasakiispira papahanaumokuakeensis TaxID=197479 RepID=A0A1E2VDU8_9GAMM|nr:MATE family efflux transporter [Terasakiispira papahanaumokuakeensis]ODC05032.1 MATE family efflux transporter [Terasakiispira papahanaumokuakeensis]